MKSTLLFLFLLSLCYTPQALAQPKNATNEAFRLEFLQMWDRSEQYTLAIIEAAGDSLLEFKPQEDAQSFKELILHMSQTIKALSFGYINDQKTVVIPRSAVDLTKEDLVNYTQTAYAHVRSLLQSMSDDELSVIVPFFSGDQLSKRQVFMVLSNHNFHHRAQCATYLRLNGKVPPRFVGW